MKEKSPANLNDLVKTITPPKGIKRRNNIEGSELFDCDGEELEALEDEVENDDAIDVDLFGDEAFSPSFSSFSSKSPRILST